MDWSRIIDEAEGLVVSHGGNKADLPKILGVRSQFLSDIRSGKSKNPGSDFTLSLINKMDFNPRWIQTGEGSVLLVETGDSPGMFLNKDSPHSVVGINNQVTMYPTQEAEVSATERKEVDQMVQTMTVFEIPLLTKEQVLRFDPEHEIPDPKAHSGNYPDYTLGTVSKGVF